MCLDSSESVAVSEFGHKETKSDKKDKETGKNLTLLYHVQLLEIANDLKICTYSQSLVLGRSQ